MKTIAATKTIAGMPVREVLGRECVLVGYGRADCIDQLAADLHPDTYKNPDGMPGRCSLCPATHTSDCAVADCAGGYLVDTKWLPLLLMRLPAPDSNR